MAAFAVVWLFSSTAGIGVLLQLLVFITLVSMAAVPVGMYIGSANPVVSSKNPVKRLDTASNIVITVAIFAALVLTAIILGVLGDDGASPVQLLTAGAYCLCWHSHHCGCSGKSEHAMIKDSKSPIRTD